jgi:hypothetical protein
VIIVRMRYGTRSDGSFKGEAGADRHMPAPGVNAAAMTILDLIKATVICGAFAYLIYSYPVLGQIVLIGFLSLLWLAYARKTIASLRRR